jgi:hypothetical protein
MSSPRTTGHLTVLFPSEGINMAPTYIKKHCINLLIHRMVRANMMISSSTSNNFLSRLIYWIAHLCQILAENKCASEALALLLQLGTRTVFFGHVNIYI